MPVVYQPWFIYKVSLVASPTTYEFLDILVPDASGNFDRLETDDAVVDTGYAFALEKFTTGDTEVQVAIPGSAVPFIAGGVIRPTGGVKFNFAATEQTVVAAAAADLAAGRWLGRLSHHHEDHELLRVTAADDVVVVRTGVV
jgi:hypothetical protein